MTNLKNVQYQNWAAKESLLRQPFFIENQKNRESKIYFIPDLPLEHGIGLIRLCISVK